MSVYPAEGLDLEIYLGLEELYLIGHVAHVLLALLLGDDEGGDHVGLASLGAPQDRARLDLILSVKLCSPDKLLYYFYRAVDRQEVRGRARGRQARGVDLRRISLWRLLLKGLLVS